MPQHTSPVFLQPAVYNTQHVSFTFSSWIVLSVGDAGSRSSSDGCFGHNTSMIMFPTS